jgi:hypothetical protein
MNMFAALSAGAQIICARATDPVLPHRGRGNGTVASIGLCLPLAVALALVAKPLLSVYV